jgi:hypothetical protein
MGLQKDCLSHPSNLQVCLVDASGVRRLMTHMTLRLTKFSYRFAEQVLNSSLVLKDDC